MQFFPGVGDHYRLGRAFLQAAFLGRNFRQKRSWLAQAPGPAAQDSPKGLTNIESDQTELYNIPSDPQLFAQSWNKHWAVLHSGPSGLSAAAKIGIGVSVSVGALVLIATALWTFFVLRRRKEALSGSQSSEPSSLHLPEFPGQQNQLHEMGIVGRPVEIASLEDDCAELKADAPSSGELEADVPNPVELQAEETRPQINSSRGA
ncbi:uncharacterized protein K452DRAFT_311374 [Aplosporella prunicola CBS 121167]|uniref:Mid2 domain-containing protein n=1 Tax=Aplosporella prunicola CBS 121167 TaxID=1176127 RepID=A0A6A6B2J0_9PEZI|nr:uncharacterized protein K452DRAFT_311374 [Aplosporella prunicola CBS 121167]KAF2138422.1 hypothetical protein K452DRAFT_311374 [Aplosporella prunicola CBS 121167]